MDSAPSLTLVIPSDVRMLSAARMFVEAFCQSHHLDCQTVHSLVLATGEAFTNIIRHAHRDRPEAQIQIQCQLLPEGVAINLLDEGDPFDIEAVPDLAPSEMRLGGRGVYLMRTLMDELTCRRRQERGNTLRMVKHCFGEKPALDAG